MKVNVNDNYGKGKHVSIEDDNNEVVASIYLDKDGNLHGDSWMKVVKKNG